MSEKKTTNRRKKSTSKKRSVVDSAVRNAAALSDGCNPEFVIGAEFDGIFEMPIIKKPNKFIIPEKLVPFSKMEKADPKTFAVCEYENDVEFRDLLVNPDEYIAILKKYQGFISPDCSVYRDMPLALQITNIYRSRTIGYCFQKHGVYVIPCVRWGDERTYTKKFLPERVAFLGVEKHSIVSVGSYGQLKHIFREDEGHLPDTPENRKLISDLANDCHYYVGKDKYGNDWHVRLNEDGTQDWVRHQNMVINEGGRNIEPKPWNPKTGLYKNIWEDD